MTECYRIEGHYAGEPEVYRSRAEVEEYRKKEPIGRFRAQLLAENKATLAELEAIDHEISAEMAAAVQFAKDSPEPDPATAMDYYLRLRAPGEPSMTSPDKDAVSLASTKPTMSPDLIVQVPPGVPAKEMTYQESIREALREEMLRDERVFLMGEDV